MKTRLLILLLSFGITHYIFPQTQLTTFDYQVPTSKYNIGGIVNLESQDYFIEINYESIRVTAISSDSIHILYELSDFPEDDQLTSKNGRFPTRSGFVVESIYLYEIFKKQIRKRNILTGIIEDVYLFPNEEIKYINSMIIVNEIIHFTFWNGDSFGIYNITNQEFEFLPFNILYTFRSQNTYYMKTGNMGLTAYNALDGSTSLLFENERNNYFGKESIINDQKGIIFGDWSNGHTRFFNADTTFILNCDFSYPFSLKLNIYETEEQYVVISELQDATIEVRDKSNCNTLLTETYLNDDDSDSNFTIFNSPTFDDDFILFTLDYGDVFSLSKIMLYDKKMMTLTLLSDGGVQYFNPESFYRVDDKIYCIGQEQGFDQDSQILYSIDLNTKTLKVNKPYLSFFNPLSFGPSISDSTYLITRSEDLIISIHKFKDFDFIKYLYTPYDTANEGINYVRYLAIDEEKLIFKYQSKIYLADNHSNSSNKISLVTVASQISNLTTKNGQFEGLVNYGDSTYHLKYDADTDLLTNTLLDQYTSHISSSFAFSKYIFGTFSVYDKIYFDTELESFKPIPINNKVITIHKSNQHILFLTEDESGYSFTSFINDEFISFDSTFQNKPEIISKNNGAFFVVENIGDFAEKIDILKSDGTLGESIISTGKKMTRNQTGISNGPLSAFMYRHKDAEELEIILHRHDKFYSHTIPFTGTLGYPITWYKAGNSLILKSEDNIDPGIYIFTIGKESKKLEINGVGFTDQMLLFATHNEDVISFMVDDYPNNLEIVQYNTETDSISKKNVYSETLYYEWFLNNQIIRISPSQYYVVFPNEDLEGVAENSELFLFDSDNLTIEQSSDLNQSFQYSNPHQFMSSPSHLFFIARTSLDNSYQLYVKAKEQFITTTIEKTTESDLKISPNPSSNFISIKNDAEFINIFDTNGNLVKSLNEYAKNKQIDINELKNGVYFLEAIIQNQKIQDRFIKI